MLVTRGKGPPLLFPTCETSSFFARLQQWLWSGFKFECKFCHLLAIIILPKSLNCKYWPVWTHTHTHTHTQRLSVKLLHIKMGVIFAVFFFWWASLQGPTSHPTSHLYRLLLESAYWRLGLEQSSLPNILKQLLHPCSFF
jgi:hypothetical protein